VMAGCAKPRGWASATPCRWTPTASTTCRCRPFPRQSQRPSQALICGYPVHDASVPKGRLYARYLTHVWVWINSLSLPSATPCAAFASIRCRPPWR
jgi:hypothetical protein